MSNGPSNIRINPFVGSGGATTYVNLTETHIIPSVSPFVIRLNEVPEKRDPSNMKCVYVDDTTGAVTTRALTEVAATPAAGQFRPDYSTKADKDDSWNTGLIEFNSADAGKIVQITYTGMGTLAAVQSNKYPSWYTDRGDGSDGDFIPNENTTIDGIKNYKRVFIKKGITVTCEHNTWIKVQGAVVICGDVIVKPSGGNGGAGGASSSSGKRGETIVGNGGNGGAGGGYDDGRPSGGAGGMGGNANIHNVSADLMVGPSFFVVRGFGSGGGGGGGSAYSYSKGVGGKGGGVFLCTAVTFTNTGTITANGENGATDTSIYDGRRPGSGGGGGGGSVFVIANTINKQGTISVDGGKGGRYGGAQNGANGVFLIISLGVM